MQTPPGAFLLEGFAPYPHPPPVLPHSDVSPFSPNILLPPHPISQVERTIEEEAQKLEELYSARDAARTQQHQEERQRLQHRIEELEENFQERVEQELKTRLSGVRPSPLVSACLFLTLYSVIFFLSPMSLSNCSLFIRRRFPNCSHTHLRSCSSIGA